MFRLILKMEVLIECYAITHENRYRVRVEIY